MTVPRLFKIKLQSGTGNFNNIAIFQGLLIARIKYAAIQFGRVTDIAGSQFITPG